MVIRTCATSLCPLPRLRFNELFIHAMCVCLFSYYPALFETFLPKTLLLAKAEREDVVVRSQPLAGGDGGNANHYHEIQQQHDFHQHRHGLDTRFEMLQNQKAPASASSADNDAHSLSRQLAQFLPQ